MLLSTPCFYTLSCSLETAETILTMIQRSERSGRKMLTQSLLAVTELQPLYRSVDAVRAHDRPGNKQKHNGFKNISTSCLIQSLSLSSPLRCTK